MAASACSMGRTGEGWEGARWVPRAVRYSRVNWSASTICTSLRQVGREWEREEGQGDSRLSVPDSRGPGVGRCSRRGSAPLLFSLRPWRHHSWPLSPTGHRCGRCRPPPGRPRSGRRRHPWAACGAAPACPACEDSEATKAAVESLWRAAANPFSAPLQLNAQPLRRTPHSSIHTPSALTCCRPELLSVGSVTCMVSSSR